MTIATILPTARTVFLDTNDNPLAGGKVYFFVPPNTSTPKNTWQDAAGVTLNANPVILDSDGSALIYGSGQYLQEVFDADDNLIYTGLTQDVYGMIVSSNNTFTGNNTFSGTNTFSGGFVLPSNYVTNAQLAQMQANTVKLNATAALANPTDFALTASTLLGRGSSGNIAKITLGTGLSFSGTVINGPSPLVVTKQLFPASATYTPTVGMVYCIAEVVGGGGGGGGVPSASANAASGGGGAGAYGKSWLTAADIGVSKAVTIGAAGAGGNSSGGAAGTGGTSSLGVLISCAGGLGGTPASGASGSAPGGVGGSASAGNIQIRGTLGSPGIGAIISGAGASSQFGAGGTPVITAANGNAGQGFGSGGSGSFSSSSTGGAGTAGYVVITEFCQT